jgi:hypothetical protein
MMQDEAQNPKIQSSKFQTNPKSKCQNVPSSCKDRQQTVVYGTVRSLMHQRFSRGSRRLQPAEILQNGYGNGNRRTRTQAEACDYIWPVPWQLQTGSF